MRWCYHPLTLADTGTVKSVDNVSGTGMITPDNGGQDVRMVFRPKPVKLICHV
jgi:hypothetical protein